MLRCQDTLDTGLVKLCRQFNHYEQHNKQQLFDDTLKFVSDSDERPHDLSIRQRVEIRLGKIQK
nr:hypothetical protein TetV2_00114 [Oceanusvirus sp.]